jgi:hypothetical protein
MMQTALWLLHWVQVTAQLFDYSWHHWCGDTQNIIHALSSVASMATGQSLSLEDAKTLSLTCDRWFCCLKSIRRMLKFGFPSDAKAVQVCAGSHRQTGSHSKCDFDASFEQWLLVCIQHASFCCEALYEHFRMQESSIGGEDGQYESCYHLQEVPAVQKVVPPMLQAVQAFIPLGKPLKGNVIGELSGRLTGQVLLSSRLKDLDNFCTLSNTGPCL